MVREPPVEYKRAAPYCGICLSPKLSLCLGISNVLFLGDHYGYSPCALLTPFFSHRCWSAMIDQLSPYTIKQNMMETIPQLTLYRFIGFARRKDMYLLGL